MTQRSRFSAVVGAHRTIRRIRSGEGPFAGDLVTHRSGVAVRTSADALRGWAGWAYAGAEHVAAPLDVALGADGQDVLLPWCVRTALAHLAEGADDGPLPLGEAVTLAVSVLRGLLELGAAVVGDDAGGPHGAGRSDDTGRERGAHPGIGADRTDTTETVLGGTWWLTDHARPVFAIVPPGAPGAERTARDESTDLLLTLAERVDDRTLQRVLTRLADAVEDPRRLTAEATMWEQQLLEIAAPRPLRVQADGTVGHSTDVAHRGVPALRCGAEGPLRRRDLRMRAGAGHRREIRRGHRDAPRSAAPRASRTPRGTIAAALWRAGRGALALATSLRTLCTGAAGGASVRRSAPRTARNVRRRWAGPALVAVTVAAAVAVLGALWPAGTGTADAADRAASPTPAVTAAPSRAASRQATASGGGPSSGVGTPSPTLPVPVPVSGASAQQDPAAAAEELIASALSCQSAPATDCAELWDSGAAAPRPLRGAAAAPVLIEDYGDVAAIRNGEGDDAQMVVIIRKNAEWRIRDVYDIADPPSEGAGTP